MENKKRLVYADEVEDLINGLDSLPWEEDVRTLVNSLSTADAVEVVRGEWIDAKFVRAHKNTSLPVVQCSKCKCYFCDVINSHHFMYHYCPNCGAKMEV